MRPVLVSFLAFLWAVLAQGAFAGQLIVIDSTAPELMPGQVVDGSKVLGIAAGARVTLIAEDGRVTTLKGPFSGRPGAGPGAGPRPRTSGQRWLHLAVLRPADNVFRRAEQL